MKRLAFFPANLPISPARNAYFEYFGYQAEPYAPENLAKVEVFLLATPVPIPEEETFVAPDFVWQRFLEAQAPSARLVRTGLHPNQPEINYMHWLQPPEHLGDFLQQCSTLRAISPPQLGHSENLDTIWKKFLDGHDKNGFSYHFIDLINNLKICSRNLLSEGAPVFEQKKRDLIELNTPQLVAKVLYSWNRYLPYWQITPFPNTIQTITELLQILKTQILSLPTFDEFSNNIIAQLENLNKAQELLESLSQYFKTSQNHG